MEWTLVPHFRPLLPMFSWLAGGIVLVAWFMAEVYKLSNRRLLDKQSGTGCIRNISWREFERLVAEAYRRKGYVAEVIGNASGDGGVDIQLSRPGERVLVQCKQWRAWKVGVNTVRELLGVVVSQKASRGVIVTSGQFTQEARSFAQSNRQIELLDGLELAELIRGVQNRQPGNQASPPMPIAGRATLAPRCPSCGSNMVLRTARKGTNAGSEFWGCPKYPRCRGIRQFSTSSNT